MRPRQFTAPGVLGRHAYTVGEIADFHAVARDFLETLADFGRRITPLAHEGAAEVTELGRLLRRLRTETRR